MDIREAHDLYLAGEIVEDPYAAAPDLEYVMYPEEAGYEWRMVVLPIAATGCDLTLAPTDGCSKEDEDERFDRIRNWIRERGGAAEALAGSPPIARLTDEFGLDLVDGRHRLAIACEEGLTALRMMVGAAPGWRPEATPAP